MIQNDLIAAVNSLLSDTIRQEIARTLFVSVLLDDTSDVTNIPKFFTRLRCVYENGQVVLT
jgi:translation initiation factor 6 (eIF-6)